VASNSEKATGRYSDEFGLKLEDEFDAASADEQSFTMTHLERNLRMERDKRILVVDDNDFIRIVVSKMLSRLGYEVSSADGGENGLSIFLKNRFDMVFSDYEMPGMDGVAFACGIKKSSPHTPVVIMTGAGRETVLSRNSTAVDEVIAKPFTLADIDGTMQSLSGRGFR
jgi:CheY-like chemotaxis protein